MRSPLLSPFVRTVLLSGAVLLGLTGCAAGGTGGGSDSAAGAALDAGNYEMAIQMADSALAVTPGNARLHVTRAKAFAARARATTDMEQRAEFYREYVASLDRAVAIAPDDPAVFLETNAREQSFREMFGEAETAFQSSMDEAGYTRAADLFMMADILGPDTLSAAPYNAARAYLQGGMIDQAVVPLQLAVDRGETDPQVITTLSRIYFQTDQPSQGVEVLEMALERTPGDAALSAELANAYVRTDDTERALNLYSGFLEAEPDNAEYQYNYGAILIEAGRYEEAIGPLTRATELRSDYFDAYYNLGVAYQSQAVEARNELQEIEGVNDRVRELETELRENLEASVAPLERAQAIAEASTEPNAAQNLQGACGALFQIYTALNRADDAASVAECAGFDTN